MSPMSEVLASLETVPNASLPTRFGPFQIYGFESEEDDEQLVALVRQPLSDQRPTLVRVHSQCVTGDIFHSLRCDCGDQLEKALQNIAAAGSGVLLYQFQEGRGIGLINKLHAYQFQDQGADTVEANARLGFEADLRSYRFCALVLLRLGISRIRLMSNNPDKIRGLEAEGLQVVERVPLTVAPCPVSQEYLKTKKEKLGHLL